MLQELFQVMMLVAVSTKRRAFKKRAANVLVKEPLKRWERVAFLKYKTNGDN